MDEEIELEDLDSFDSFDFNSDELFSYLETMVSQNNEIISYQDQLLSHEIVIEELKQNSFEGLLWLISLIGVISGLLAVLIFKDR